MVPEAAYVPFGDQRIIRRLFPFYAIARANDILRLRALVTISIIPYKFVTNILSLYEKIIRSLPRFRVLKAVFISIWDPNWSYVNTNI